MTVYMFQCNRCFIKSGIASSNPDDAPTCCGGQKMSPVAFSSEQDLCDKCEGCSGGFPFTCPLDDGQGPWGNEPHP